MALSFLPETSCWLLAELLAISATVLPAAASFQAGSGAGATHQLMEHVEAWDALAFPQRRSTPSGTGVYDNLRPNSSRDSSAATSRPRRIPEPLRAPPVDSAGGPPAASGDISPSRSEVVTDAGAAIERTIARGNIHPCENCSLPRRLTQTEERGTSQQKEKADGSDAVHLRPPTLKLTWARGVPWGARQRPHGVDGSRATGSKRCRKTP